MKKLYRVFGLAIVVLLLVAFALPTGQSQAAVGFHISGRNLLDANGNNFIMRGISHAHTWYPSQTSSFANIKATGANTVRVVLSGGRWAKNTPADVANVISLCKTNRLICVLEDHDTTGYGEDGAAYSMAQAVTYWKELQSVLTGQEAYIIINIGNEPYGNNNAANWIADTKNAIAAMRAAGFQHTLMVDAPNWGQDWQFYMRDNAVSIFNSDPDKNTILSIHMYGVFDTAAEIQSYLSTFVSSGLPLVVGEFGWNHSDGNPDEDTIMAQAQANGIGYIGWSWSGNGGGVEYLDMVTSFNPSQLTSWGDRIINGANGLKQTSQECSVFGGPLTPTTPPPTTPPPTTPPPTTPPPTTPPPSGVCTVGYVMNQWNSGFTADVKITNNSSTAIRGWSLVWSFANGQRVTGSWNATVTQSGSTVTASNPASYWNGTIGANGGSVSFGFQATHTGTNAVPTQFTLNGVACNGGTPPPPTTPPPTTPPPTTPPPTTPPPTTPPPTTPPPTTPPPTTPPPTTPPPTTPPPTTPPPAGGCSVSYVNQNDWGNGATINVTVRNNGTSAVNGWTLTWAFPGSQQIVNLWNGSYTQSGASVSVRDAGWNATIGASGGTVSFGFNISYSGSNSAPSSFRLNGTLCQ